MLKKLAKYGNSTTLVIDKAILELLNMDESSMVKLHTDGKSLIITPVNQATGKVSYESQEAMQAAIQNEIANQLKNPKVDQHVVKNLMPHMQQDFKEVFERHTVAMLQFKENLATNKEFQDAMALLANKYDPVTQSADYLKELENLKMQFCPEIAELTKDLHATAEKCHAIAKEKSQE